MNARQKAKYYKRKYEELSNVKINPIVIRADDSLKRYRVCKINKFPKEVIANDYDYIKSKMAYFISDDMIKFIKDHMNIAIDEDTEEVLATFNFWIQEDNKNEYF